MRAVYRAEMAGACFSYALPFALFCVMALAPGAMARETPGGSGAGGVTPPATTVGPVATATAAAAGQSVPGAEGSVAGAPGVHSDFSMNPDAKWACAQQTVVAEPAWRGQQGVSFTFPIQNKGTADLQIRAKGG
jgi:hypothetical protein